MNLQLLVYIFSSLSILRLDPSTETLLSSPGFFLRHLSLTLLVNCPLLYQFTLDVDIFQASAPFNYPLNVTSLIMPSALTSTQKTSKSLALSRSFDLYTCLLTGHLAYQVVMKSPQT